MHAPISVIMHTGATQLLGLRLFPENSYSFPADRYINYYIYLATPYLLYAIRYPDSNIHGANKGPTRVLSAPYRPPASPMNLAFRVCLVYDYAQCLPSNQTTLLYSLCIVTSYYLIKEIYSRHRYWFALIYVKLGMTCLSVPISNTWAKAYAQIRSVYMSYKSDVLSISPSMYPSFAIW